jgi:sterol desaturase/sphingolipid hydroxylase (fatty acid hydroxylase superfamily)
MTRFALVYLYAPAFFLSFIGAALMVVAEGESKVWFAALLLVAIAISMLAERLLPYESKWNHSKGDGRRDVLHATFNEFGTVVSVASIPWLVAHIPGVAAWPSQWPLWLQLAFAILVADFGITFAHYASHKVRWLWRLHAVHHSAERMYGFNGLMKHPLHQAIETATGTTPLVLIGMPLEVGALLGFAVAIQLLLQHSNVDMRVGALTYFWAVAPGHRHHHIASKAKGDVNFGLFTMLWDHLLGTFVIGRPAPRDGELGVAGRPDFPVRYWSQLVEPFRRWPDREPRGGEAAAE